MVEVLRTNDPVLLSFARHVLAEAGIPVHVADQHTALIEGSIGIFPRRMLVAADDVAAARVALHAAGLARELKDPSS